MFRVQFIHHDKACQIDSQFKYIRQWYYVIKSTFVTGTLDCLNYQKRATPISNLSTTIGTETTK